ncbi:MAG: nucleotide sugar dehydrogenase [Desulfobacterales bacterium]|nr:nucleotide sugar dehydrogenase [Desulfobacterales bacterium]
MLTFESLIAHKDKVAVVGLGYVGLPLAVHLSHHFSVTGFDLKADRIAELKSGRDRTLEVAEDELKSVQINFSSDPKVLSSCRLIVIAVPTPIDEYRIPDLSPLRLASEITGRHMAEGTCIVYESTVYPGVTEEVCLPILTAESGMTFGTDFTVGYSPERINPGDKAHSLDKIKKIVSGSDPDTLQLLEQVYGRVVTAGIHPVSSIRVAEAAKVIENTQRDLNIALMNELAMIFDKMGIDTTEVLEAAATKWNFLPFKPGLVGGHCIGVDPYYLTFKAESLGYHPEMILAGRRINDSMGKYVAQRAVKLLFKSNKRVHGAKIAVLGITFKEDVPDLRNTKVVDLIRELEEYGIEVRIHDPLADAAEARHYYGLELSEMDRLNGVDAVVVAVMHTAYKKMGLSRIAGLCAGDMPVLIDLKSMFSPAEARKENVIYWRL